MWGYNSAVDTAQASQASAAARSIKWSPHDPSRFVVVSNDVRLFQIDYKHGHKATDSMKFYVEHPKEDSSGHKSISLVATNNDAPSPRCVAWCPDAREPSKFAVGATNGRIAVATLPADRQVPAKTFSQQCVRPCLTLAWNATDPSQLASGFDKVRNVPSILVWDANAAGEAPPQVAAGQSRHTIVAKQWSESAFDISLPEATEVVTSPKSQFAAGDSATALNWKPGSPNVLCAGFASKCIRVFDTRSGDKATLTVQNAHSKSVLGCLYNPVMDDYLATFSDDGIRIWDTRMFGTDHQDPYTMLNLGVKTSNMLRQIEWCPTRRNLLAGIFGERNELRLWDLDYKEDGFVSNSQRSYTYESLLSSFSWHPSYEGLMITLSDKGIVELVSFNRSFPLVFLPDGTVSFSQCKAIHQGNLVDLAAREEAWMDVSIQMRERALLGYRTDVAKNAAILGQRPDLCSAELRSFWNWMRISAVVQEAEREKRARRQGIESVQQGEDKPDGYIGCYTAAIPVSNSAKEMPGALNPSFTPLYRSEQRELCMNLCGWMWGSDRDAFLAYLQSLRKQKQYERAAAVAVWTSKIADAIDVLRQACEDEAANPDRLHSLEMAAVALAGYQVIQPGAGEQGRKTTTGRPAVLNTWSETCRTLTAPYQHPYLQAMIKFLQSVNRQDLDQVLSIQGIHLWDRTCFACSYLNDHEVAAFLEAETNRAVREGSLEGVALAGLSTSLGVVLLQNYVDRTGDIQTPCLASCICAQAAGKLKENYALKWLAHYRNVLDQWRLWEERCTLDVAIQPIIEGSPPQPQVYSRCPFCAQPLTARSVPQSAVTRLNQRGPTNQPAKVVLTHCPECRKPLPRCCICLLPLDIVLDPRAPTAGAPQGRCIDQWWTWCQTCQHGGHSGHMMEWFMKHDMCPVTDCRCKCNHIDLI
eukprot:m51a1_g297 hypothetical protein (926) ;mRNA; f:358817-363256